MKRRHHLAGAEMGMKSKGDEAPTQRERRAEYFNFETILRNASIGAWAM